MATVKGQAEVSHFMAGLPKEIETKLLRGAARAGAKVFSDEIKLRTTIDEVRENLRTRTSAVDTHVTARIDVKPGWARSLAVWAEFGTSPHFIFVADDRRAGRSVARINRQAQAKDSSHSLVIGGNFVGEAVWHPGAQPHPAFRPARDIKAAEALAAAQGYINAHVTPGGIVGGAEPDGDSE